MKQVSVVIGLIMVLAGVVFGFVLPSVGSSNNEILVRKWVEESPVEEDSLKESRTMNKRKEIEEKNDSSSVKNNSSNETPKSLKTETKEKEEARSSGNSKIRKVTKEESLQVAPLKFSRAAHFRPVERIVEDTVVTVSDSLHENDKDFTLKIE